MKAIISTMSPFPTTLDELKQVVQKLSDELDPFGWICKEIEAMPKKLQAVLDARGLATRY
jgi:hypothetical protein